MKLDMRLRMVVGLVRPGKPLADIGTDHAYVPVFLVSNDIIPSAIASDVKVGPLQNARSTITKYGLDEKIIPVLSNGLISIPHDIHDFVIAGMGGELIVKILSDSPWVEEIGNHFVFQPQTHAEDLREYLYKNGYEIIREDVVKDSKRIYLAMEVVYTGKKYDYSTVDCYVGKLSQSTSIYRNELFESMIKRLEIQLKATRDENIKSLIEEIREAIV